MNGKAFSGIGTYEARIACQLYAKHGAAYSMFIVQNSRHPRITKDGEDRECGPGQYIGNMVSESTAVFKYFALKDASYITITVRGKGSGEMIVADAPKDGKILAWVPITPAKDWHKSQSSFSSPAGITALYFSYPGKNSIEFLDSSLSKEGKL